MFMIFTSKGLAQLLPALIVCLGFLSYGIVASWTSPVLPKLEAEDSPIPVTRDQGSWIVSVPGFSGVMAPFIGVLSDRLGRKPTLILTAVPVVVNWIIIFLATSPWLIMTARAFAGLGLTAMFVVGPMYMGELAQEDIRGLLGAMMDMFFNLGSLFSYCVGPYTSYPLFSALCCIFPLLFVFCMLFVPESPYHLVKKNKSDYALLALMRLRNDTAQGVKEEMTKIEESVKKQMKNEGTVRDLFTNRASRRGLLVTAMLVIFQQFSGMMAIAAYTEHIFRMAPGITLTSSQCAIVVGAIQVVAGFTTLLLVEKVGRRPLLMTSSLGCGLAHCVLGTYLYFHDNKYIVDGLEWIPLTSLVLYVIFFCLGLSPLPVLMLGEVFPSNVKDLAVSISIFVTALSFAIVTKVFQIMEDSLGSYSPFWFFSAVATCGSVFVFFIVPETKGRRFETIIENLNGNQQSQAVDN